VRTKGLELPRPPGCLGNDAPVELSCCPVGRYCRPRCLTDHHCGVSSPCDPFPFVGSCRLPTGLRKRARVAGWHQIAERCNGGGKGCAGQRPVLRHRTQTRDGFPRWTGEREPCSINLAVLTPHRFMRGTHGQCFASVFRLHYGACVPPTWAMPGNRHKGL
jgi:hypothetical protein